MAFLLHQEDIESKIRNSNMRRTSLPYVVLVVIQQLINEPSGRCLMNDVLSNVERIVGQNFKTFRRRVYDTVNILMSIVLMEKIDDCMVMIAGSKPSPL